MTVDRYAQAIDREGGRAHLFNYVIVWGDLDVAATGFASFRTTRAICQSPTSTNQVSFEIADPLMSHFSSGVKRFDLPPR